LVVAGQQHLLAVGRSQILVTAGAAPRITVLVRALWRATEQQQDGADGDVT
jgi:hypothetical protein